MTCCCGLGKPGVSIFGSTATTVDSDCTVRSASANAASRDTHEVSDVQPNERPRRFEPLDHRIADEIEIRLEDGVEANNGLVETPIDEDPDSPLVLEAMARDGFRPTTLQSPPRHASDRNDHLRTRQTSPHVSLELPPSEWDDLSLAPVAADIYYLRGYVDSAATTQSGRSSDLLPRRRRRLRRVPLHRSGVAGAQPPRCDHRGIGGPLATRSRSTIGQLPRALRPMVHGSTTS